MSMKVYHNLHKNMFLILAVLFTISFVSAMTVTTVNQGKLYPGEATGISIDVKNTLDDDVEDVSLILDLSTTSFIPIGSSEDNVDDINEGDTETFNFDIKASQDIKPGDYNIPYTITYNNGSLIQSKKGVIGITVGAKTELSYSADTETPVIGQKGKVILKIVNTGFGDIKFVTVKLNPSGFNLLTSDDAYIGTVSSDDFETADFNVVFKDKNARLNAVVEYRDFDNRKITQSVDIPLNVYTNDEAIELGIIQKSNTTIYAGILLVLIIAWVVYRVIVKRRKRKHREV